MPHFIQVGLSINLSVAVMDNDVFDGEMLRSGSNAN